MDAFLAALMAFPTIIYSCLLGLILLYWLIVIVGALDIDFLSPDHDVDIDIDADGSIDGMLDAHGLANFLSVGKVPVTIIASAFSLIAWILSLLGEAFLRAPLSGMVGDLVYGLGMGVLVFILSLIGAGIAVRPLRGLFKIYTEHGEAALEGRMVRITSRTVSDTFGTATCDDNGAGILMNVVCREGVTLKRDEMAVVVSYDKEANRYLVAPFNHTPEVALDAPPTLGDVPPSTPSPSVLLERPSEPPQ